MFSEPLYTPALYPTILLTTRKARRLTMMPPDAPTPIEVGRKMQLARLPKAPPVKKIISQTGVPHIASSSEPIWDWM